MIGAQAYYRNCGFVHFIEERRKFMFKAIKESIFAAVWNVKHPHNIWLTYKEIQMLTNHEK